MNRWRESWRRLGRRQQIMILAAAALVTLAILNLSGSWTAGLPLPGNLKREAGRCAALRHKAKELAVEHAQYQAELAALQRQTRGVWRKNNGRINLAEVQGELEKVARRAKVQFQNVGAPRSSKLGDHLSVIEIPVRLAGSMHDLSRLLTELDQNEPRFGWSSCTLRPDNLNEPKQVLLDGTVQVLYLSESAAAFVQNTGEGHTP